MKRSSENRNGGLDVTGLRALTAGARTRRSRYGTGPRWRNPSSPRSVSALSGLPPGGPLYRWPPPAGRIDPFAFSWNWSRASRAPSRMSIPCLSSEPLKVPIRPILMAPVVVPLIPIPPKRRDSMRRNNSPLKHLVLSPLYHSAQGQI